VVKDSVAYLASKLNHWICCGCYFSFSFFFLLFPS